MVVLGVIERTGRADLSGNGISSGRFQGRAVTLGNTARGVQLVIGRAIDRRAILRADIIALAIALGRIMLFPESLQDRFQRHDVRVEHHHHDFGMASAAGADLFIGRVRRYAARVANRSAVDTVDLPEQPFRAPETAKAQMHLFQMVRERAHGRRAQNAMRGAVPDWRVTARQCFSHQRHAGFERV